MNAKRVVSQNAHFLAKVFLAIVFPYLSERLQQP